MILDMHVHVNLCMVDAFTSTRKFAGVHRSSEAITPQKVRLTFDNYIMSIITSIFVLISVAIRPEDVRKNIRRL